MSLIFISQLKFNFLSFSSKKSYGWKLLVPNLKKPPQKIDHQLFSFTHKQLRWMKMDSIVNPNTDKRWRFEKRNSNNNSCIRSGWFWFFSSFFFPSSFYDEAGPRRFLFDYDPAIATKIRFANGIAAHSTWTWSTEQSCHFLCGISINTRCDNWGDLISVRSAFLVMSLPTHTQSCPPSSC